MAAKPRNPERRMSLVNHLKEFRRRLVISVLAIVVAAAFGWWAADAWVFDQLQRPLSDIAEATGREVILNFETIAGSFDLTLQVALTIAIVIAAPVWLYQIWAFVTPGLHRHERRYAIGFLLAAVPLFLAGCVAGWFAFPHVVDLLLSFAPEHSLSALSARYYIDFVLKLMIAVGVAFVLPVFLVLLNIAGVLSARSIIRSWRWAIIGIVLFTAIATPAADVMSMFLLAGPMLVLYFGAAGVAALNDRRRARRDDQLLEAEPEPV